tara:strand:+ start:226 stop:384 length:159 start_codon:yes stop_codon:yes gene_type:complete
MTISKLIAKLEEVKSEHGDITVEIESSYGEYAPDGINLVEADHSSVVLSTDS